MSNIQKRNYEESLLASGYIKTPGGWIAHGEATPAQMVYHIEWMKKSKSNQP